MSPFIVTIVALASCTTTPKNDSGQAPAETSAVAAADSVKKMPALNLTSLDGQKLDMSLMKGHKTIFVLFQPDCDHCQNEAKQFSQRIPAFASYEVYFLSSAPVEELVKFATTYQLNTTKNFHFANTDVKGILDNYGAIQAPSIFIYSEDGTLLNNFEGEMELDVVIKYLH